MLTYLTQVVQNLTVPFIWWQATENEKVSNGSYKNKGTIEYNHGVYERSHILYAIRHLTLLILVEYKRIQNVRQYIFGKTCKKPYESYRKRANDLFPNIHGTELELLREKCTIKNESFDLLDIITIWCLAFLTFRYEICFYFAKKKNEMFLTASKTQQNRNF